ncbi:hypothetical protein RQN30_05625 [Arcanobacterium hippocoleae]
MEIEERNSSSQFARIWYFTAQNGSKFEFVEAPLKYFQERDPQWPGNQKHGRKPDENEAAALNPEDAGGENFAEQMLTESEAADPPEIESGGESAELPEGDNPDSESQVNREKLQRLAKILRRLANLKRLPEKQREKILETAIRAENNALMQFGVFCDGKTIFRSAYPAAAKLAIDSDFQIDSDLQLDSDIDTGTVAPEDTDTNVSANSDQDSGENFASNPYKYDARQMVRTKPRFVIEAGPFGEIVSIFYETKNDVYALTPPPGSFAAERDEILRASIWKKLVYPIAGGLGKVGWALAVLVISPVMAALLAPVLEFLGWLFAPIISFFAWIFAPIGTFFAWIWNGIVSILSIIFTPIGRFFAWIKSLIPEIRIPFPQIDLPPWLDWIIAHPKLWMPIVTGIVIGFFGYRRYRKSEKHRKKSRGGDESDPSDV